MSAAVPMLDARAIHAALDYASLIDALRDAFRRGAEAPVRHVHTVDPEHDGRLLLMPAWRVGESLGVKLVTVFPGNRARGVPTVGALYVLLDGATGHPKALLDGESLTLRRTAAASALASGYLARADSRVLLVVGTGQLAPCMAEAHCAARPIERVLVWGRRHEAAVQLAARLGHLKQRVEAVSDLAAALGQADIVSCATTSRDPIVTADAVRDGTHIDLVGAFTPQMRETDDALIARASLYVDTYAGALQEAGDLVQPIARGVVTRDAVRGELSELVAGPPSVRRSAAEVTLFKSVGTALEDLAAAELVLARTRSAAA